MSVVVKRSPVKQLAAGQPMATTTTTARKLADGSLTALACFVRRPPMTMTKRTWAFFWTAATKTNDNSA